MKGAGTQIDSVNRTLERFNKNQVAGLVVTYGLGIAFLFWSGCLLLIGVKGHSTGAIILLGLGAVLLGIATKGTVKAARDKRTGLFMVEGTIIGIFQSMMNKKPLIRLRTAEGDLELLTPFNSYVNSYLHKPVRVVYLWNQRVALSVEPLEIGNIGNV